jgi:hypothetical protein
MGSDRDQGEEFGIIDTTQATTTSLIRYENLHIYIVADVRPSSVRAWRTPDSPWLPPPNHA